MDDELELSDPDHPDAKQAAESTARLLVHLREKRERKLADKSRAASMREDGDDDQS